MLRAHDLEPIVAGVAEGTPRFPDPLLHSVRAPVLGPFDDPCGREEELGLGAGQVLVSAALVPVGRAHGAAVLHVVAEMAVEAVDHLPVSGHVDDDAGRFGRNRFDGVVEHDLVVAAKAAHEGEIRKALHQLFILHADHEQNCSTSSVRLVGSSKVNLFGAISAGINALWGPLHGGANQAVIEMIREIRDEGMTGREFVERAKNKNDTSRLMGFGHRVYKNFDPRMKILKKSCFEVLDKLGVHSKMLEIAVELEEIALKDEYFVERKLYPNIDFYSGVIYNAIGIPEHMFTALFAIGRLPGWIAHWMEMHDDPDFKIGRPRQIYEGATKRSYVAVEDR